MMRRNDVLLLSVRSQMLVEKMNAFYLRNWDKEVVFDISQRVFPRGERHWRGKQFPKTSHQKKTWKYKYTDAPFHKSEDGQSPGDINMKDTKKKYFWCDPSPDHFLEKDLPGGHRDYHLAWENFYKELRKAAYFEPEQVLTLLHDLHLQGWTTPPRAYERADAYLVESRERRVQGIKPPITIEELKGKERWPGQNPCFAEEWEPVRPFSYYSQANPQWAYKPLRTRDWVHDPIKDGPLPYPETTRMEEALQTSPQRRNAILQKEADDRYKQLLDGENKDLYARYERDPNSFAGGNEISWLQRDGRIVKDEHGTSLMLTTDVNYFIEQFFPQDTESWIYFWKYTSDHILFRHFVFEKTGKTLLEYTEPERFAMIHAVLDLLKECLFKDDMGDQLKRCRTDADYIDEFGEECYRRFLRMDQRRMDEERRKYLRLWSTEVSREERLDQVVETTRMRHEDENQQGIYGGVARVKDRLDRKKWAIKEPTRQVQEHEKEIAATRDQRRQMFDDEMSALALEARQAYGDEVWGTQTQSATLKENHRGFADGEEPPSS